MIFFFTDIHGYYDMLIRIMSWCRMQDPNYTIIYGGDACDRGPYGYKIIKELLTNPHVIYLYGNHEDLFVNSASALLKDSSNWHDEDVMLHCYNGGESTIQAWQKDGMPINIIQQLQRLPRTVSMGNLDFCHAGGSYNAFCSVKQHQMAGERIPPWDEENIIWDRHCFNLDWAENRTVVFGHTPVIALPGKLRPHGEVRPAQWQNGHKIDMDSGIHHTGVGLVMDCTNNKFYRFEINGGVNEVVV